MTDRMRLTTRQARELRLARAALGMSQYQLAELTGLTRPKIKRIEKREIKSVAKGDLDKILGVLATGSTTAAPKRRTRRKSGSSNGRSRRRGTSTSGRAKVSVEPPAPDLDAQMRAEVKRQLEESVLEVMRDIIGESGRVLVEKHSLQGVTLGRLFQVPS